MDFETFLMEKFIRQNPMHKDDYPDKFNDWLGTLEADDFLYQADQYGKFRYQQGMIKAHSIAMETIAGVK